MRVGVLTIAIAVVCQITFGSAGRVSAENLGQVKRIYVESLGKKSGAEELRQQLISQLRKLKMVEVVSSPAQADAILTGSAELWIRGYYSLNPRAGTLPGNGNAVYNGSASLELKGKENETIWSYLVTPHYGSTQIAKDMSKELAKQLSLAVKDARRDAAAH